MTNNPQPTIAQLKIKEMRETMTVEEIAAKLGIKPVTVHKHLQRLVEITGPFRKFQRKRPKWISEAELEYFARKPPHGI